MSPREPGDGPSVPVSRTVPTGADTQNPVESDGFDRVSRCPAISKDPDHGELPAGHPLAEVNTLDPCDVVRAVCDPYGIRVVRYRDGWAVELPSVGWRRAPGPSLRTWIRQRVAALCGAEVFDSVLMCGEDVLVTRALALEEQAALDDLDRIRAAMRTDEIDKRGERET